MDIADASDKNVEMALVDAMNQRKPIAPTYTGFCLFCSEETPHPKRWCDADCRDSYEREQRRGYGKD